MDTHTTLRARYGGTVLAAISALGLLAVPAIASDSEHGQYFAENGEVALMDEGVRDGGLQMVAFEPMGAANIAGDCEYWDEACQAGPAPVMALAEPDPYGPDGELNAQGNIQGGPELQGGGLELVAFERAAPVDITGIGLGLKGEPAGHSIGHDGVED